MEKRDGSSGNNPYVAFRRRTEKMQTRKVMWHLAWCHINCCAMKLWVLIISIHTYEYLQELRITGKYGKIVQVIWRLIKTCSFDYFDHFSFWLCLPGPLYHICMISRYMWISGMKWLADRQLAFKFQILVDRHWHHWSAWKNNIDYALYNINVVHATMAQVVSVLAGHGGALVEAITLNRRVVGSTPALAAM